MGLLVGAYFIPYPETINARIEMADAHQGTIAIPYKYVNTVEKGMNINIELEGYDTETYGVVNGTITEIFRTPKRTSDGNLFIAKLIIKGCKYNIMGGMSGTAYILVSNESVLQRIIRRIADIT